MNAPMFRGKLVERQISIKELAKSIDLSVSQVYRKLRADGDTFTLAQVSKMSELMCLSKEETLRIFF